MGLNVVCGVDLDEACRVPYEANNTARFHGADISALSPDWLADQYGNVEHKVLVGCAPCQPFSPLNRSEKIKKRGWVLLDAFATLVEAVRPSVVSMENVPTLLKKKALTDFVSRLEAAGYQVSVSVVQCARLGLPQKRRRLVLIASRLGPIELDCGKPKNKTAWQAIGKLPVLSAGEKDAKDPLHRAGTLSELNLQRIRASKPGGTWLDWPKRLRPTCRATEAGARFMAPYGRMVPSEPSATMTTSCTTFGCGRFGHPEQDRAITPREAALLQGFPKRYIFTKGRSYSVVEVTRLIGNAVPPPLGMSIGRSILRHLRKH